MESNQNTPNRCDENAQQNSSLNTSSNAQPANNTTNFKTNKTIRFCVVAARPSEEKGARVLAQALAIVCAAGHTHFSVDWIGPASADDIEVEATNTLLVSNNLRTYWHWLGLKPDIRECYNHYDALICPSLHEGVPNVICESMASALPVIATAIGDNRQLLEPNKNGLCCEPGNPDELAHCIIHFMALNEAERREMGEHAHQKARSLFSMENYLDHWESTIESYS